MPRYECQVRDSNGEIISTILEAPNMEELTNRLLDRNYYLITAKESKKKEKYGLFGGKVDRKELMLFTVQLATLVGASISLVEAVGVLADQTENLYFKKVINSVERDLQSGQSLSVALRKHPNVFDKIYCNMCEAGETGGMLNEVLERLAQFAESDAEMRGKIRGALIAPALQLLFAVLGVIFLLVRIFPNFAVLFAKMKVDLPPITKIMMAASDALINNYIVVSLSVGAFFLSAYLFLKTDFGNRLFSTFTLKSPMLGDLTIKIAVSRFSRTFASLLSAGVPILESLTITSSVMNNPILEDVITEIANGVQQGNTVTSTIKKSWAFPPMVKKMIEVGESSGNLTIMLTKAADFYEREVKESLDALTDALTPILTIVMGVVIGTIALSVFMPLFRMTRSIR